MGRKRPRAKTKTVLKSVNKMKQLVGMPKTKKSKNLNKNHPTGLDIQIVCAFVQVHLQLG